MQNDWEIKHGLNPGSTGDATGNPDGDGFNNLAEYQHNTDPNNPDTDGDGFQDDVDPDPTTPDLVLDTIFWDYFFADTFLMYVDGVPEWINLPPTSPRPVVLNGYHIGSHVTFQWQVVDDPSFEPFLVFYVPHTTFGNIIPDIDATPLDQIQFDFGDLAPPDGPWGFTIAKTTPTNADVCAGFDDESAQFSDGQPLALSVPQGGTNTITVAINPSSVVTQILFRVTNTVSASVSPSTAATATQVVSVAGLATANAIVMDELDVLGYGAQNTFTTVCSRVRVDILPKATNVTVAIWAVTAKGEPSTTPTNTPDATTLKTYLDGLFGKQANVFMNVLPLVSTNVNYDLNTNGVLEVETNRNDRASAEQAAITNAVHRAGAFNVYFVKTLSYASGISYQPLSNAFIGDVHVQSNVNISAHEIGHLLELDDVGQITPASMDRLMWYYDQSSNPCRLIRLEWETANKTARGASQ